MRVTVVGAGPAGLFFALRLKNLRADASIVVLEQRERAGGKGVGIILPERTIQQLNDVGLHQIQDSVFPLFEQEIRRDEERAHIEGTTEYAIARSTLLAELRRRCDSRGLFLKFASPVREWQDIPQSDLIVGADGVHSQVRSMNEPAFETSSQLSKIRYAWFSTSQRYDRVTTIFHSTALGCMQAHAYSHSPSHSTFIIGCDPQTFHMFRFHQISSQESDEICTRIFSGDLMSHRLERISLGWWPLTTVRNESWIAPSPVPTVLIGDAAHATHFSSGRGTEQAFDDAEVLAKALTRGDILNAINSYQMQRKPLMEASYTASERSQAWFETSDERMDTELSEFTRSFLQRTQKSPKTR